MKDRYYFVISLVMMLAPILIATVLAYVDGNWFFYKKYPDKFYYHPYVVYGIAGSFLGTLLSVRLFGEKMMREHS